jgi:hypothetical protein
LTDEIEAENRAVGKKKAAKNIFPPTEHVRIRAREVPDPVLWAEEDQADENKKTNGAAGETTNHNTVQGT